jgi:hypothetical protein
LISIFFLLDANKIKLLNGKAFRKNSSLIFRLHENVCIDRSFTTKLGTNLLLEIIEKCGFSETKPKNVNQQKKSK